MYALSDGTSPWFIGATLLVSVPPTSTSTLRSATPPPTLAINHGNVITVGATGGGSMGVGAGSGSDKSMVGASTRAARASLARAATALAVTFAHFVSSALFFLRGNSMTSGGAPVSDA